MHLQQHLVSVLVSSETLPNFDTVNNAYESSQSAGRISETKGTVIIAVKGLTFQSASSPDSIFAPTKGLMFVGGYKHHKNVFAVVTEDEAKRRTCHIFKWSAPVS